MAEWRPILGWEGLYEVSDDGRVKSLARTVEMVRRGAVVNVRFCERIMSTPLCAGYPKVCLSRPGKQERKFVHQLVCTAFHGPAPEGHEVAHNDGDRQNPRAENLRWATRHENVLDKAIHGTQLRGETQPMAKLTEEQAREVLASKETQRAIAIRLGVKHGTISSLRTGRSWKHLHQGAAA